MSIAIPNQHSKTIRIFAHVLSVVFHPLFIPAYVVGMLIWYHPFNNLIISSFYKPRMMAMVILYTAFFPGIVVFLAWRLKFIKNLYLEERTERIIPFVSTMFFYFWIYYVSRNLDYFPVSFKQFLLGVFLSSASALFANMYTKISMHGIAMGGLVGFMFRQLFIDGYFPANFAFVGLLIAGAVCTARLILNAHKPIDIYCGFFVGIGCQLITPWIVF